jgi:hypothetical protein
MNGKRGYYQSRKHGGQHGGYSLVVVAAVADTVNVIGHSLTNTFEHSTHPLTAIEFTVVPCVIDTVRGVPLK